MLVAKKKKTDVYMVNNGRERGREGKEKKRGEERKERKFPHNRHPGNKNQFSPLRPVRPVRTQAHAHTRTRARGPTNVHVQDPCAFTDSPLPRTLTRTHSASSTLSSARSPRTQLSTKHTRGCGRWWQHTRTELCDWPWQVPAGARTAPWWSCCLPGSRGEPAMG